MFFNPSETYIESEVLLGFANPFKMDDKRGKVTPLSYRPKQIHPKQIPKQKRCRNRRPQANKTLKTISPSTPLEKFIPKQKSIKSPSKHRKSYVPKHWLITPQAIPKQTPIWIRQCIMQSEKAVSSRNLDATPSKESSTPSKPQANLHFQLAHKHLTANPEQNQHLAWVCETGVSKCSYKIVLMSNFTRQIRNQRQK